MYGYTIYATTSPPRCWPPASTCAPSGHARTSTTLDRYWAFVPAGDRDAAHHLELLLQ
jgi:hypothetical protein